MEELQCIETEPEHQNNYATRALLITLEAVQVL